MDNLDNLVEKTVVNSKVIIAKDPDSGENVRVKTEFHAAVGLTDEQSYECLKSIIASYAEYRKNLAEAQGTEFDKHRFINSLVIDLQML